MSGQVSSIFEKLKRDEEPTLLPVPTEVRGFRVRLDLHGAKPPVWRRLDLPGDLTLPRVHDVIQAAMGWSNSHLHRFRTGRDHRSPYFVTSFDLDEGEEGVLEDDVRLDQLLSAEGDELWYEYDFGDGWDHMLKVEEVLEEPPSTVRCLGGRMACPPEDCGGIGGYEELAAWVRSGYDDAQLPDGFDDAAHAHDWLPLDWHPDHFDVEEANAALAIAVAEPVAVTGELAELLEQLERRGIRLLREVLGRPLSHGPTDVSEAEAARLTETYRIFLDVLGDGVALTAAGYLPPAVVEQFAERTRHHRMVDRQGQPGGPDTTRRRRPRHCARPRAGQRPQGPADPDRRRHPLPAGPAGTAGGTSSDDSPWAPRTPSARQAGWRSPWSAAAYRPRSGAARSATCCSRSGGEADTTGSRRRPPTARPSTSSANSPALRASAVARSRASTSPSRPPPAR